MAILMLVSDENPRIDFPDWVDSPTPCKTRTFSVVLPKNAEHSPHGAIKIVRAFPNRPLVKLPRINRPGYYYGWADLPYISLPMDTEI